MTNINRFSFVLIAIFCTLFLFGCSSNSNKFIEQEINSQIDVYGVKLLQKGDIKEINSEQGTKENCIYGYEYNFTGIGINIGYDANTQSIRRVTSKSENTSILSISKGFSIEDASKKLYEKGFKPEVDSKYKFLNQNIRVILLSLKGDSVDGVTIEIVPSN